jgi:hypothetical protein
MKKLSVTYKAPKNDSKIAESWGHVFYDGKAETVTVSDEYYQEMIVNRFFECGKATDVTPHEAEVEKEKTEEKATRR